MDLVTYSISGISIVAIITGLIKVFRDAGLPSKYAPAIAVLLGVIIGVSAALYSASAVYVGALGGIAAGLMSCGIYDLGKKAVTSVTDETTKDQTTTEETPV